MTEEELLLEQKKVKALEKIANSLDALTVNKALGLGEDPSKLPGSAGVLQFDPTTKDRLFFSQSVQKFNAAIANSATIKGGKAYVPANDILILKNANSKKNYAGAANAN